MFQFLKISFIIVIANLVVKANSVTVNPLCPTNKIAPHKRILRYDNNNGRTFGTFYDLLAPGDIHNTPSSLQEEPQPDEFDDCGEIEDYDENDLSSIPPQSHRIQKTKNNQKQNRFFFGWFQQFHQPKLPTTAVPFYKPTRPPPGGYFGSNSYRPQKPQQPTDYVKPVFEDGLNEPYVTYQPGLVGGPLGHIVGLQQVIPTRPYSESTKHKINYNHAHTSTAASPHTRKPKRQQNYHGDGIIGSFLDLLI